VGVAVFPVNPLGDPCAGWGILNTTNPSTPRPAVAAGPREVGMFSGAFGATHWLIVIAVLVLLFGAKRLPEAARGLGQSMRVLRAELRDDESGKDEKK
jgi:sec-independent protein translocase protein TatA